MTAGPGHGLSDSIAGYAADVLGCPLGRISGVTRFESGNRHLVYRVSYLDEQERAADVVVRVSLGATPVDRSVAEYEARVLEEVGGHIAPEVYDFRPESVWFAMPSVCMQFIPGTSRELSVSTPAELEELGATIGRVHRQPTGALETTGNARSIAAYAGRRLREIVSGIDWVRDPLPPGTQHALRSFAESLERDLDAVLAGESFRTGERLVLLHGDPESGNILWTPSPVLVDWEYARLGDPADEIAYLFDQNGLGAPLREAFWSGYRGVAALREHHEDHLRFRVDWWERVTLLGSTLWWAERLVLKAEAGAVQTAGIAADGTTARPEAYYRDEVDKRVERIEQAQRRLP